MRIPIVLAVAATVLIGPLHAQSPTTFEVVSIKPNKSGAPTPGRRCSPPCANSSDFASSLLRNQRQ